MKNKSDITYHIIGAGIAGLSCAYQIKQKHPEINTKVYEASDNLGGRAYAYFDKEWKKNLDNATHVIIGANKNMRRFVKDNEWENGCIFWDKNDDKVHKDILTYLGHILKSCCNTKANEIANPISKKILRMTFPWSKKKRRIYFSKGDLNTRIINILSAYADKIYYNYKLDKIESQFGKAAQLNFGDKKVNLHADDKVIIALDNRNYAKLFNKQELKHNAIINIFYHTSQKIHLPQYADHAGVIGGLTDWIFVNNDVLGVTISAAEESAVKLDDLATQIWKELDILRGVNSAFVPEFKASCYKYATISQDTETNMMRPQNAKTCYPNVFVAGDWTMKNYPCCMETAVLSAQRAIKTALKS